MKYVLIISALFLAACTKPDHAANVLEKSGYTDIQMRGYGYLACSKDDFYHDKFTARGPLGHPASGVVCTGLLFRGSTISLD